MLLGFIAPFADGFQPAVAAQDGGADLRGQDGAVGGQLGLAGIVDGDVKRVAGPTFVRVVSSLSQPTASSSRDRSSTWASVPVSL